MKKKLFNPSIIQSFNFRGGFTMLELVIVIAIMAVLSTVGFVSLSGFRGKQNLKKTTDELVAAIVGTQKRSISQDAGSRWNVRFSNTTSSGSQYIVFSGTSYATSAIDKIYGLNRNIQFSEPYSGSTSNAFFAPFTGTLPSKKIISMVTGRQDGFVGDIIMNTAGLVTGRNESGLVGYWHLDENTSTTAYDASGMGNTGALVGTSTWQTGMSCVSGSCLSFNGSGQYIDSGANSILGTKPFTLTVWIITNSVAGDSGAGSIGTSASGQSAYIGTVAV
ncbi:MAG: prepilin-type N-terminal cleavage/methylation domain-containing protein, partial [Patescibacteria group bacterium]